MNLTADPWIPCTMKDGTPRLVSLREAFSLGDRIQDVDVTPPQRVALVRLLLCVSQAALDGPADTSAWKHCREQMPSRVETYLERHREAFELYRDDGAWAFLQVPNLEPRPETVVDKLDFGLASGNNPTLFDHDAGPDGRPLPDAQRALNLVTYQCFSPGGLIGSTRWGGTSTSRSSEHAPCVESSMLHTLVRGNDLLSTVHLNMVTRQEVERMANMAWGRPVWESPPEGPHDPRAKELVSSYLGRLTPVSRAIRLARESTRITLANGIAYPKLPEIREPMATVVVPEDTKGKGQGQARYLPVDLSRHPWRELGSILATGTSSKAAGAIFLGRLRDMVDAEAIDIWTGGLATNQAKLLDVAEWTFHLEKGILGEASLEKYSEGVAMANRAARLLGHAIAVYYAELGVSAFAKTEQGTFARNDTRTREERRKTTRKATAHYWSRLDTTYGVLVQAAADDKASLAGDWYSVVRVAMQEAFRQACAHETPRQIRAFARAESHLRFKKPDAEPGGQGQQSEQKET